MTNAAGQPIGYFDAGVIMDLNGAPIATGVDIAALTACEANATVDPQTGTIEKFSSSSVTTNPTDPTDPTNPTSSAGTNPTDPTSSAGGTNPTDPTSSAGGTNPTDPTSSAGTEPKQRS